MQNLTCPCGGTDYAQCCEPLHLKQKKATSAEQLMRSRYSAFAVENIAYLVETTALLQQQHLDQPAILAWSQRNTWQKLEIIEFKQNINKNHASVEFKAHYNDGEKKQCHHEKSFFVCYENSWYFLDPTLEHYPTLKQPCVCGSGKKYKHCCAEFIV